MAQYKVPQDVEADDKLIGPFSFRQFVYLLIAAALIALAVGLFQLFPLLGILPIIPALLFIALALPLKKDQPMETYLAALVSYYLKPRTKRWTPGQRESTILITAPRIVEEVRTRDLSEEEATHRLSFLADIVDSQGYSIRGASNSSMREDLVAEANATSDMFDNYRADSLQRAAERERQERHEEAIRGMREAIDRSESYSVSAEIRNTRGTVGRGVTLAPGGDIVGTREVKKAAESVVVMPNASVTKPVKSESKPEVKTEAPTPRMAELADNSDFSVETIAKEANRIKRKDEGEVFISLR